MSNVKWVRLTVDMFDDEKIRLIEQMPEADTILIIWIKLLAQAGKTNASGYIYLSENIPYTDEMLATIFNRPISTVRLALKTFKDFGMINIDDQSFISIANWEKHQNEEGLARIREQTRKRVARHRERKQLESPKQDVTLHETLRNATDIEEDKELDIDKDKEYKRHKYEICDMNLAELLFSKIKENNPSHKEPNLEKWANDFRLIRERDKRTEEQIRYLINWSQEHHFWHTNILSPAKLRKQFDKLVMQVKSEKINKQSKVVPIKQDDDKRDYGF